MIQCGDPVRIALRVLIAIVEGERPSHSDIEALKKFAPLAVDHPADELARDVLQQALRRRSHEGFAR